MKKEKGKWKPQKCKELLENAMKNYISTNGQPRRNDKFLEKYSLPRLTQEERKSLNRPFISSDIELAIKKLPKNKIPGPYGFTD